MKKLKYIGKVNIFIPCVGVGLPSGDNIIIVTEKQANGLLRYESGGVKQFEEVKTRSTPTLKPEEPQGEI